MALKQVATLARSCMEFRVFPGSKRREARTCPRMSTSGASGK